MILEKKLLVIGAVLSGAVVCTGILVGTTNIFGTYSGKATNAVEGTLVFSRSTTEATKISSTKYMFGLSTSQGNSCFMYSYGSGSISSGLVASVKYSENVPNAIEFYKDSTRTDAFSFQNITSISFTTASTSQSGAGINIYTSSSALSPAKNIETTTPSGTFTVSNVGEASFLKIVPSSVSYWLDITSITINYSCTPGGVDPQPELSSIYVVDAKRFYAKDSSFVEPTVKGKYTVGEDQVIVGAEFSGFNSSSCAEGQVITVSYGGKSTTYTVNIRPTENSVYVNYIFRDWTTGDYLSADSSAMEKYAEPSGTITMVAPSIDGYEFFSFYPDESREDIWAQIGDDFPTAGSLTLTMSSYDLEMTVCYVPAE